MPLLFNILFLGITLSLVFTFEAGGQFLSGHDGLMRTAESVHNTSVSRLPVRVLLLDGRLGRSSIGSHYENGDLRSLQDPSRALHTKLESYGLTQFRKLRLEGTFRFVQEQEDQIGWRLSRDALNQPYYYANIRPGDWDNDRYAVHVNGGSRLWKDRLLLAFGIDYNVERLARYNDPRPLINYHNLFLKVQAGLQLGNHVLALYAGSGDAKETGIVRNYNRSNDSFGRTEYNLITVTGMGSYSLLRRSQYERPLTLQQAGLTWIRAGERSTLSTEVVYSRRESSFSRRGSSGSGAIFEPMGTYIENEIRSDIFASRSVGDVILQLVSETVFTDGYDENTQFLGANYFNRGFRQELHLLMHNADETLSLQLSGHGTDRSINDRNASHAMGWSRAGGSADVQLTRSFSAWRMALIPGAGYTAALQHNLTIPESRQNLYSEYIAYPMYALNTSDVLFLRGGLQVQRYMADFSAALLLQFEHQRITREGPVHPDAAFHPGTIRNGVTVTLQFFH